MSGPQSLVERGKTPDVYDRIGRTYTSTRSPDPRIAEQILRALGSCSSVLNVGAGTGSYEPTDRFVIALEPSSAMIAQRGGQAAPVVRGIAEQSPFPDNSFDAVMAVLTVHHWTDQSRGLSELMRLARKRIVVLTFDPSLSDSFWLVRDYFPSIKEVDSKIFQPPEAVAGFLENAKIEPVLIPADCQDGFLCAFWKRPEAYLDPVVRAGISCFPSLPADEVDQGISALRAHLESGQWERRNQDLIDLQKLDLGYRLIVADSISH